MPFFLSLPKIAVTDRMSEDQKASPNKARYASVLGPHVSAMPLLVSAREIFHAEVDHTIALLSFHPCVREFPSCAL
jgi:hypothetical protein